MCKRKKIFVYTLGIAQDGGYPHANCKKECCDKAWKDNNLRKYPSCIAIVDCQEKKYWLLDVTPDVKDQIHFLDKFDCSLSGIFITHAHFGHYMGLFNLGLEVMNLREIPIYVMPQMKKFIINNSLTRQLLDNNNIKLINLENNNNIVLNNKISVMPFDVPHRNELSETVGFKISGPNKSAIYLPDIDSWKNWEKKLIDLIKLNNFLFIDGTFYSKNEISHRDISRIPHPEITDTMKRLSFLDSKERKKIYFTHLNHTNRVIINKSKESIYVKNNGYNILREKEIFEI